MPAICMCLTYSGHKKLHQMPTFRQLMYWSQSCSWPRFLNPQLKTAYRRGKRCSETVIQGANIKRAFMIILLPLLLASVTNHFKIKKGKEKTPFSTCPSAKISQLLLPIFQKAADNNLPKKSNVIQNNPAVN